MHGASWRATSTFCAASTSLGCVRRRSAGCVGGVGVGGWVGGWGGIPGLVVASAIFGRLLCRTGARSRSNRTLGGRGLSSGPSSLGPTTLVTHRWAWTPARHPRRSWLLGGRIRPPVHRLLSGSTDRMFGSSRCGQGHRGRRIMGTEGCWYDNFVLDYGML